MRNHTVVIGYGTKGRTAVDAMLGDGIAPSDIVVVDMDPVVLETAAGQGLVTVQGSATKSDVLRLAGVQHASAVIVAANRDDTAVLVTLSAREIAPPKAKIVAAIRESENTHLLRQSGADSVVISSETAGRLLGIATTTPPNVVEMIEDLLTPPEAGFAIAERDVEPGEVGGSPRHCPTSCSASSGTPAAAHRRPGGRRRRGERQVALHPQGVCLIDARAARLRCRA